LLSTPAQPHCSEDTQNHDQHFPSHFNHPFSLKMTILTKTTPEFGKK
jgi:hypothetical protein